MKKLAIFWWGLCFIASAAIGFKAVEPVPTIALTFDQHSSAYTAAYPIMKERGLIGTFYNDPEHIDRAHATTAQLKELRDSGWSIQAYTGINMVNYLETEGYSATKKRLAAVKEGMAIKGFTSAHLAAGQRAWNQTLRDMLTCPVFPSHSFL